MTSNKLLSRLLKMKGFKVTWFAIKENSRLLIFFFRDFLIEEQRNKIRFASCDMSRAYIGAIEHWCPKAMLVIDRFHIVKALNVRKEEWRKARGEDKKALKGFRWLLFILSKNRAKGDTRSLNQLKTSNRRIHRAWVLKDEFEAFWEYSYIHSQQNHSLMAG